jgi:mannose-6-phosphate isomerase
MPLSISDVRKHLLDELLPLWYERGVDRTHGGFHNRLTRDLQPAGDDHKRLVVQTRQIYVFSHAALLGAPDWALRTAEAGVQFLWDKFWDRAHGGWYFKTTPAGAPFDRRKDTYAHAFALFALAYFHRATGDGTALEMVESTLDLLDRRLADPQHGGYLEGADDDWTADRSVRRQNPHMHLLEAFLSLYEARAEPLFRERADAMVDLLQRRFFDRESGCLLEFFTPDWEPRPGPQGRVVEPGHHFEWVWLLHRYAELFRLEVAPEAEALFSFALRFGVDPRSGAVFDELDPSGAIVRPTQRVWPQTEFLQALAARYAATGEASRLSRLQLQLDRCLGARVKPGDGIWEEQLDRSGRRVSEFVLASSVYHVFLALSEVARVLPTETRSAASR